MSAANRAGCPNRSATTPSGSAGSPPSSAAAMPTPTRSARAARRAATRPARSAAAASDPAGRAATIRPARPADADGIWAVLEPVIRGGEHYALPRDMTREAALAYWGAPGHDTFVAVDPQDGRVLGTYYVR